MLMQFNQDVPEESNEAQAYEQKRPDWKLSQSRHQS